MRAMRDPRRPMLEREWQEQVEQLAVLLGWAKYHTYDSRKSDEDSPI